jgi:hypothetical protein
MYYYRWTPSQIDRLTEAQWAEAWQALAWCREEERKASEKQNNRKG